MSTEPQTAAQAGAVGLLERDHDLAVIDRVLSEAVDGDGAVLLVEGPPGIGKTSLLAEMRRRARSRKLTVLTARGGEIESGVGFGVVRQLLDAPVAAARGPRREELLGGAARLAEPVFDVQAVTDGDQADITHATLHGLYWLVSNLAERAPLVLAVDDVHWADEPSIRFLTHLALRLAGMPVLVGLGCRSGAESRRPELRPLLLDARTVLRPGPLGGPAVEQLVAVTLGADAAAVLGDPCREATGGNPFLLAELLGELRREARPAREIKPDAVRGLGPERIASALLLRVGQLDDAAPALARAVAVLGERAGLTACAELAALEPRRARELADELVALTVLDRGEPLRFVHPIVRTAIYDDIPVARRNVLHARAARLLAAQRADPEQVAVHLVATEPTGDQGVVAALRRAARHALAGGAPDAAAALLRRALDEPPDRRTRPLVDFELGSAEHQLGALSAREHLRAAAETAAGDPVIRAQALIKLAVDTQADPARQRAQLALYERAAREVQDHDRELSLQLQGVRLGALIFNPDLPVRFEEEVEVYRDLPATTAGECLLLSFVARKLLAGGGSVIEIGAIAERAAAHPDILRHPVSFWRLNTIVCLVAAERYEAAEELLSRSLRGIERSGSAFHVSGVSWLRGWVRYARGDLRGAESDGRAAFDSMPPNTVVRAASWATPLLHALVGSGRLDEARALLAEAKLDADLPPMLSMIPIALGRARLSAAAGHLEAARIAFEDVLRRGAAVRGLSPFGSHEAPIALVAVLHGLGDTSAARALAEQTLRHARATRSRRLVGGALRVSGLALGGQAGLELLTQAVDELRTSPSLLWRAEALVDLGAALRRDGQRGPAGDALREGMDLAHRCGAKPLVDRAADELRAAGARPRRPARSGADALTASERRIAEQAAAGMSNKEIAQALFVTLRTVEMHLSHAYTKLGIGSRDGLPAALGR